MKRPRISRCGAFFFQGADGTFHDHVARTEDCWPRTAANPSLKQLGTNRADARLSNAADLIRLKDP